MKSMLATNWIYPWATERCKHLQNFLTNQLQLKFIPDLQHESFIQLPCYKMTFFITPFSTITVIQVLIPLKNNAVYSWCCAMYLTSSLQRYESFNQSDCSTKLTEITFWEDDWNLEVRCLHVNIMNSSTFIKNINASFPVNNWKTIFQVYWTQESLTMKLTF